MVVRKHWFVAAAAALAAAAAGASYATFADTEVAGSAATSGTLSIDLKSGGSGDVQWGKIGPLTPQIDGDPSAIVKRARITNTGTVQASVHYQAVDLVDGENECPRPEQVTELGSCGPEGELSRQLQVEVVEMVRNGDGWRRGESLGFTSLRSLASAERGGAIRIGAGQTACLQFEFSLPEYPERDGSGQLVSEPVTNAAQGDSSTFRMRFTLRST